jgi:hypothetical protein
MKKNILTCIMLMLFIVGKGQLVFDYQDISGERNQLNSLQFDFSLLNAQALGDEMIIKNFNLGDKVKDVSLQKFQVWSDFTIIETENSDGVKLESLPELALYRSDISDAANDFFMYIAINKSGFAMGYIENGHTRIPINRPSDENRINRLIADIGQKELLPFCGSENLASYHEEDTTFIDYENYDKQTILQNFIAVEMDYPCYQLFDTHAEALEYPMVLFGAVSTIYERDIKTHMNVTYLHVWTGPDPYTFEPWEVCNCSGCALEQFQSYWQQNFGGVSRNNAVMLSGALDGGCAWIGALNNSNSYAVCGIWGVLELPIPFNGYFNWDPIVVAHEIGHNYNSRHTHCYSPPIDKCWNSQSGCYSGPVILTNGTIMSYCHVYQGVIAINMQFHSRVINEKMRPFAASKLTALPSNLVLTSPNTLGHYAATTQVVLDPGFNTSHYFEAQILNSGKEVGSPSMILVIYLGSEKIANLQNIDYPLNLKMYPDLWNGLDVSGNKAGSGEYQYFIYQNETVIEKGSFIIE